MAEYIAYDTCDEVIEVGNWVEIKGDLVEVYGDVDQATPLVGVGLVKNTPIEKEPIEVVLLDNSRGVYPGPRHLGRNQAEVNKYREGRSWYVEPHLCVLIDKEDYLDSTTIRIGDVVTIHGNNQTSVEGCVGTGVVEEEYDNDTLGVLITDTSSTTWIGDYSSLKDAKRGRLKDAKRGRLKGTSLWRVHRNFCKKVTAMSATEEADEEILVDLGDL